MPVSAKTGSNVKEMFDLACELVMKRIDEGKIDFSNEGFGVKLGR